MSLTDTFDIISSSDECFNNYENVDKEIDNKLFQPDAKVIAKLYSEIKNKKILDLNWKFPGRLKPEEYEQEYRNENQEMEIEEAKNESKDNDNFNDFDFDEDLTETNISNLNPLIKKKPNQVTKKVTKLDKVMSNIKKYQKIEKTKSFSDKENI